MGTFLFYLPPPPPHPPRHTHTHHFLFSLFKKKQMLFWVNLQHTNTSPHVNTHLCVRWCQVFFFFLFFFLCANKIACSTYALYCWLHPFKLEPRGRRGVKLGKVWVHYFEAKMKHRPAASTLHARPFGVYVRDKLLRKTYKIDLYTN